MKTKHALYLSLLCFSSCKNGTHKEMPVDNIVVANEFVDAFYSFDGDSLQTILSSAKESWPNILYYQKWAECGNYEVINREGYVEKNDSIVVFPVTVKDDLMGALHINFNVTDTFHIAIRDGIIRSVTNSSNDPAEYYEAKEWVKQNRPEFVEKACEGIWEGGPTPCDCVQGMVKGFAEFIEEQQVKP